MMTTETVVRPLGDGHPAGGKSASCSVNLSEEVSEHNLTTLLLRLVDDRAFGSAISSAFSLASGTIRRRGERWHRSP